MSLSDKGLDNWSINVMDSNLIHYKHKDVKEAIKELKVYCENYIADDTTAILCMIEKIFGEELCSEKEVQE